MMWSPPRLIILYLLLLSPFPFFLRGDRVSASAAPSSRSSTSALTSCAAIVSPEQLYTHLQRHKDSPFLFVFYYSSRCGPPCERTYARLLRSFISRDRRSHHNDNKQQQHFPIVCVDVYTMRQKYSATSHLLAVMGAGTASSLACSMSLSKRPLSFVLPFFLSFSLYHLSCAFLYSVA